MRALPQVAPKGRQDIFIHTYIHIYIHIYIRSENLREWVHALPEVAPKGRQDIFILLAHEELRSLDDMIVCDGPRALLASEGFGKLGSVAKMRLRAALDVFLTSPLRYIHVCMHVCMYVCMFVCVMAYVHYLCLKALVNLGLWPK